MTDIGLRGYTLDTAWMSEAVCASVGDDLWYPPDGFGGGGGVYGDAAKRICRTCPVKAACLEYALETRDGHGVWGGLTANERAVLARDRGIPLPHALTGVFNQPDGPRMQCSCGASVVHLRLHLTRSQTHRPAPSEQVASDG